MTLFSKFLKDQSGATAIEYGLIAAGISVAIVTVVGTVGTKLNATFTTIEQRVDVPRHSAEVIQERWCARVERRSGSTSTHCQNCFAIAPSRSASKFRRPMRLFAASAITTAPTTARPPGVPPPIGGCPA